MIRLIGLGKMGLNLFDNMIDNNIAVTAYDLDKNARVLREHTGQIVDNFDSLISDELSVYWIMLPQGEATESVFQKLCKLITPGSIIIDGGNAHFRDTIRRSNQALEFGIDFLDIGVSGGKSGARYGACMMVGGEMNVFDRVKDSLNKLCVEKGCLYVGPSGSGHYLKMVHNGIEYGMMQSIAEGFNIIENTDLYTYDLHKVSQLFNSGSVIRSWLMELITNSFEENSKLENISKVVASSGEGKWAVEESLRLGLNTPVIAQSLFVRFSSNDESMFGERVTSSLRNQFGGHSSSSDE